MPHLRHPTRVTLDVVMEDFWTRPSGVYGKPVWLRPGVLQLVYDDDNDQLKRISGPTVPGGHAVFTRTASVYSMCEITDADLDVASASAATAALRHQVAAFTQRVGSVYLVEANILGFATHGSDLQEPCVLSSSIRWALSDYQDRFGCPPSQIVLHLDVNGSLALGDLAGAKKMEDMARRMADDTLLRHEKEQVALTEAQEHTLRDATKSDDTALQQDCCFSASYSSRDFVRSLILCQGALAMAAIREIDEECREEAFADAFNTASIDRASAAAAAGTDRPALTIAIRTNGVEHRQASVYVQRLVLGVLGIELSEEKGTVRRYLVTHEEE